MTALMFLAIIVAAIAPVIRLLVPILPDIDAFIAKVLKSRPRMPGGVP